MLSPKMQEALNRQINEELFSAYVYLGLAARCDRLGLPGFANWFRQQYREELVHMERFFAYVLERDGEVKLAPLSAPPAGSDKPLALFEATLEHERKISGKIYALRDLAREENDHSTDVFLQWFITEQVEEEATVKQVIDKLRLIGDNREGLFLVDQELGARKPDAAA